MRRWELCLRLMSSFAQELLTRLGRNSLAEITESDLEDFNYQGGVHAEDSAFRLYVPGCSTRQNNNQTKTLYLFLRFERESSSSVAFKDTRRGERMNRWR